MIHGGDATGGLPVPQVGGGTVRFVLLDGHLSAVSNTKMALAAEQDDLSTPRLPVPDQDHRA